MLNDIIKLGKLEVTYKAKQLMTQKPMLRYILWETTLNCNAKCKHCGSNACDIFYDDELKTEEIKKAFKDLAERNYDTSQILVTVTGGEPLLRKDIFEVIKYATNLGFKCSMTTNGILLNNDVIQKLKDCGLVSISISIDGLENSHDEFRGVSGSYRKIINNIEKLKKARFLKCIQITTVVNRKNITEMEELYKIIKDLNIDSWRVINIEPIGRANQNKDLLLRIEDYKYLFEFIKEKRKISKFEVKYGCSHFLGINYENEVRDFPFFCLAGITTCSILYNGDIYVCTSVERRKELVQGNIKVDNLADIWENKFEWFRNKNKFKNPKCENCKEWKYCLGDSLHSWNFEKNEPLICMKKILD